MSLRMKQTWVILSLLLLQSCIEGPDFFSKDKTKIQSVMGTNVVDGVTTTQFDPNSTQDQLLEAGELGSVVFPAGSFNFPITIATSEASTFATSALSLELGLGEVAVAAAGSAMFVRATNVEGAVATNPFSVSLPIGTTLALNSQSTNYAVAYKFLDPVRGVVAGIIPSSEIVVSGSRVVFNTIYFGAFQAITTSVPLLVRPDPVPSTPVAEQRLIDTVRFTINLIDSLYQQRTNDPSRGFFDTTMTVSGSNTSLRACSVFLHSSPTTPAWDRDRTTQAENLTQFLNGRLIWNYDKMKDEPQKVRLRFICENNAGFVAQSNFSSEFTIPKKPAGNQNHSSGGSTNSSLTILNFPITTPWQNRQLVNTTDSFLIEISCLPNLPLTIYNDHPEAETSFAPKPCPANGNLIVEAKHGYPNHLAHQIGLHPGPNGIRFKQGQLHTYTIIHSTSGFANIQPIDTCPYFLSSNHYYIQTQDLQDCNTTTMSNFGAKFVYSGDGNKIVYTGTNHSNYFPILQGENTSSVARISHLQMEGSPSALFSSNSVLLSDIVVPQIETQIYGINFKNLNLEPPSLQVGFLAGSINAKARLSNINLSNLNINLASRSYVGGLIGKLQLSSETSLRHIHSNQVHILGCDNYCGGLIGLNSSTMSTSIIHSVVQNGSVQMTTNSSVGYVGGFLGYSSGFVSIAHSIFRNSQLLRPHTGGPYSSYAGGLIGGSETGASLNMNYAALDAVQYSQARFSHLGGLIGSFNNGGNLQNSFVMNMEPTSGSFINRTVSNGLPILMTLAVTNAHGRLYVGTSQGLAISQDNGRSFVVRTSTHGLPHPTIQDLFVHGTHLYVATSGGLALSLDYGESFSVVYAGGTVHSVYAENNSIYVSTGTGLLISHDNGSTFTLRNMSSGLGSNLVRSVHNAGGYLYVATSNGLSISTDGGITFMNRTTANGLGSNSTFKVSSNGSSLYVATQLGLSVSYDNGTSFTIRTTANGLGANDVRDLFVSGSKIIAATVGGLSISIDSGNVFSTKTTAHGLLSNSIHKVSEAQGSIYAATSSGLSILTEVENAKFISSFSSGTISALNLGYVHPTSTPAGCSTNNAPINNHCVAINPFDAGFYATGQYFAHWTGLVQPWFFAGAQQGLRHRLLD